MTQLPHLPTVAAACALVLLLALESWIPAALGRLDRMRHARGNLTLGAINALASALATATPIALVLDWTEKHRFGVLGLLDLPPEASAFAAILLFDGWMYLWHRANHRIAFLWRFHRLHHSDPVMDATTAVRFHPGEILISSTLRLLVIPLFGIRLWQLLLYETLMMPVILFHHSNVRFPERWDRMLRFLIVSPAVHRVHHSCDQAERDTNYGAIFSFWDRMGRTFRIRKSGQPVVFGLEQFRAVNPSEPRPGLESAPAGALHSRPAATTLQPGRPRRHRSALW